MNAPRNFTSLLIACCAMSATAVTATITVEEDSGAKIPDARISLLNQKTGEQIHYFTFKEDFDRKSTGLFRADLQPGKYQVEISSPGFSSVRTSFTAHSGMNIWREYHLHKNQPSSLADHHAPNNPHGKPAKPLTVEFTVDDVAGAPVSNAEVTLRSVQGHRLGKSFTCSAVEGRCRITLPSGQYAITLDTRGFGKHQDIADFTGKGSVQRIYRLSPETILQCGPCIEPQEQLQLGATPHPTELVHSEHKQ